MLPKVFSANTVEDLTQQMLSFIDSEEVRVVHNIQYVAPVFNVRSSNMVYSAMVTYSR